MSRQPILLHTPAALSSAEGNCCSIVVIRTVSISLFFQPVNSLGDVALFIWNGCVDLYMVIRESSKCIFVHRSNIRTCLHGGVLTLGEQIPVVNFGGNIFFLALLYLVTR